MILSQALLPSKPETLYRFFTDFTPVVTVDMNSLCIKCYITAWSGRCNITLQDTRGQISWRAIRHCKQATKLVVCVCVCVCVCSTPSVSLLQRWFRKGTADLVHAMKVYIRSGGKVPLILNLLTGRKWVVVSRPGWFNLGNKKKTWEPCTSGLCRSYSPCGRLHKEGCFHSTSTEDWNMTAM